MRTKTPRAASLAALVAAAVIALAACTMGATPSGTDGVSPSPSAPAGSPGASASTGAPPSTDSSPAPTATALPAGTPPPTATALPPGAPPPTAVPRPSASVGAVAVSTPAEAARLVLASDARFRSIGPYDPNLIGQAAWYKAAASGDGFEVVVRIGWGDCPSGCIDEHVWTFRVNRSGDVTLVAETGSDLPAGTTGGGGDTGGGSPGVSGRVTAGPTCPVERFPPDPACAPRAVAGAVLVVTDDSGGEVARATSDAKGDFAIALSPGGYVLAPQPVAGLMGTAAPQPFTIGPAGSAGSSVTLDVEYDTGIR